MNNPRLLFNTLLVRYKQALESLNNGQPETWLRVLFARDRIEQVGQPPPSFFDQQAQKLIDFDQQLRQKATGDILSAFPSWRKSFAPPEKYWWWFLDQAVSKTKALNSYEEALKDLKKEQPETLLPVLLARDNVEKLLRPDEGFFLSFSDVQAKELLELDEQLRQKVTGPLLEKFETLRMTRRPLDSYWWWFLDLAAKKRQAENDLLSKMLTGLLLVGILYLAPDIIKRLWDGAPLGLSISGTLITLILTASPLTKYGQEVAISLMARIPRLQARFHHQAMAGMALMAFVLLLLIKFLGFPSLVSYYNREGLAAIDSNPTAARQHFQRAVALDADMAVGYYHLGVMYEEIGQPKKAISWYEQAIEHDLNLPEAYSNLGRLYILQDDPKRALQVLHAGRIHTKRETKEEQFIQYKLLSNLGWAYFELKQPELAYDVLQEALKLEKEVDTDYRSAVPHYHLALIYEELKQPDKALREWEDSLRYITSEKEKKPEQWEWEQTIYEHLEKLRKEIP